MAVEGLSDPVVATERDHECPRLQTAIAIRNDWVPNLAFQTVTAYSWLMRAQPFNFGSWINDNRAFLKPVKSVNA